jgi:beta-N-acetylhexosaminidase
LAAVGVNVNLAPVADLVTTRTPADNAPIGFCGRNYGRTSQDVVAGAGAFARGMQAGGVIPTFKHFPGLGGVTANTDDASGVVDGDLTADSAAVLSFWELLDATPAAPQPWVMMSTAVYSKLDPAAPAAFSPVVVGLLRERFAGVILTDDLSAATQVATWTPGERAIAAITAGVDIVLFSRAAAAPAAMDEVLARAQADPDFNTLVNQAAQRVAQVANQSR